MVGEISFILCALCVAGRLHEQIPKYKESLLSLFTRTSKYKKLKAWKNKKT